MKKLFLAFFLVFKTTLGARDIKSLPVYPNCGISTPVESYRIRSNKFASHGEHPWYVIINSIEESRTLCGGSLINPQFVLTAAHCYEEDISDLEIQLGRWKTDEEKDCPDKNNDDVCEVFLRIPLSAFTIHDDYKVEKKTEGDKRVTYRYHDIAIVKLAWSVSYTYVVKPVCLPTIDNLTEFSKIEVSGFGHHDAQKFSVIKRKISMKVETCLKSLDPENQFCTIGEPGEMTCIGDSGGAAIVNENYLVGILSTGPSKCSDASVSVQSTFTNVSSYIEWIKQTISS